MSVTALTFWLVYIGGIGASILTPVAGVLLYVLVYHLNPQEQWWGNSVRAVGLRPSMTVAIAIAIGLAVRRPRFRGIGRQFPAPILFGLGLALLALASTTWGYGLSERGTFMAEKIVKVMIFVLVLIRCVQKPHHYHFVVIAWLCGVLYIGYQALGEVGVRSAGRLTHGLGGPDFGESSGLAVHLVATLPLIGAMFFMARRWWVRALILLTGALTVNTIIMTRTRNVVVGLVAMIVVAALSLPRGYRRKGWAAIAVGTLLALQLVDPAWWNRMSTIANYRQDPSAVARLRYWRAAAEMARDHPAGIGLGNFHEVVKDYVPRLQIRRSAHSTYFACLAELGYPGLALLIAALAATLWRLGRIRREAARIESDFPINLGGWQTRFHLGWHAMALRASLCGYLACSAFTTRLWAEDFWILIGLAACLENAGAHIRHRATAESQPGTAVAGSPRSKTPPVSAEPVAPQLSESHQAREAHSKDRKEPLGEDWGVQKTPANGAAVIYVNPHVLQAPWTLTGPNGYWRAGVGSAAIEDLAVGDYTLTWREVPGGITPTPNPDTRAVEPGKSIEFAGEYEDVLDVLASVAADLPPIDEHEVSAPSAFAGGDDTHTCSGRDVSSPFDTESAVEAGSTSTPLRSAPAGAADASDESADSDRARMTVDCECLANLDDEDEAFLALLTALGSRVLHDTQRCLRGQEPCDDVYADLADVARRFGDYETGYTQGTVPGDPDDDDNLDASDLARG